MANYTITDRDIERFKSKIIDNGERCWGWTGSFFPTGYAIFNMRMGDGVWRPTLAHRVSHEIFKGPIASGLQIDHLCRNRPCINPAHLEVVTQRTNVLRGDGPSARQARQTHCIHDHEFSPENTYVRPNTNKRECRECMRERDRRRGWRRGVARLAS